MEIRKIPGGISVDGLAFRNGKCGCTTVLPCCYSWSKVRQRDGKIVFTAKATGPETETKEICAWGYSVRKEGTTVDVSFEDDGDKIIFTGFYPPKVEAFLEKGWELVFRTGERTEFDLWRCAACRWLYREKEQRVLFADLPDDWTCPVCKAGKISFEQVG